MDWTPSSSSSPLWVYMKNEMLCSMWLCKVGQTKANSLVSLALSGVLQHTHTHTHTHTQCKKQHTALQQNPSQVFVCLRSLIHSVWRRAVHCWDVISSYLRTSVCVCVCVCVPIKVEKAVNAICQVGEWVSEFLPLAPSKYYKCNWMCECVCVCAI